MPSWSTPAYSPDRSLVWPNSFYYLRTDAGGANLPGTYSVALANTTNYHGTLPFGELFRFEPFGTDEWNNSGSSFPPLVTAGYFHEVWPGGATTPTTWTIAYPQGSTGTSHLYFGNLRQENAFKALPLFGGGYVPQSNGGYDRHAVLWAESVAYGRQLMEAYGYDGVSPNATQAVTYDLTDYTLPMGTTEPAGVVAGRLPVAPFQFTYADLVAAGSGDLGHMIGWVAANYANAYQWPARADDGEQASTYLKAGSVIRLSDSWVIPAGWPQPLKALARTLQHYGAVLFDKNSTLADSSRGKAVISTVSDPSWPTGAGNLTNLWAASGPLLSDFEEVDISSFKVANNSIEITAPGPTGPTAAFTRTPGVGTAPLTVTFTDTSVAGSGTITSWAWDFGDGNTSTLQNPTHTYTAAGSYTVTLSVTDSNALSDGALPQSVVVSAAGVGPSASGTAVPSSGVAPLTVNFTDTSVAGTSPINFWYWDFDDGFSDVTQNPSHTFTVPGTYAVQLSVGDSAGGFDTSAPIVVTVSGAPGDPECQITTLSLLSPCELQVTIDVTADPGVTWDLLIDWDDGSPLTIVDTGTGTETGITATHTYLGPTAPTISVWIATPATTGTPYECSTVPTLIPCGLTPAGFCPIANVTSLSESPDCDVVLNLLDIGNGTKTYTINWGDGNSDTVGPYPAGPESLQPVNHSYATAGTYTITVTTTDGSSVSCSEEWTVCADPVTACPLTIDWSPATLLGFTGNPLTFTGSTVRCDWEDSANCGGTNPNTQTAYMAGTFVAPSAGTVLLTFDGVGELQNAGYETIIVEMERPGDPGLNLVAAEISVGGDLGCTIAPQVTTQLGPDTVAYSGRQYEIPVGAGVTNIVLRFSTNDPIWHINCWGAVTFDATFTCVEPPPPSAPDTNCLPGAQLGFGEDLRVFLVTRGATDTIAELSPDSGYFTRELDSTSDCEIVGTVTGISGELCCDDYREVYPWITEVYIWRDGRDAWSGPVTEVEFDYGKVTIRASDLTAWWDRRTLPDMTFVGQDLATIFDAVANAAMAPAPVANFTVSATPVDIFGDRSYQNAEYEYASDALDELSKTGIDWTCYGRTVLAGGTEVPADPYFVLLDDHWTQPPTVRARGNDQATRVVVRGEGVAGVATASADYLNAYGLLVRVFDEKSIKDLSSAQAAAQTRLELLRDQNYIETPSGATLTPYAPITLPELIPGIRVRVSTQATCRPLTADFRLKSVKVDFQGGVSVDLEPLGTNPLEERPQFAKMIVIGDSLTAWSEEAAVAAGKGEPYTMAPSDRWQDLLVSDGLVGYSLNAAVPGLNTRSAKNTPIRPPQPCDLLVIYLGANDMVHQDRTFPPGPFVPDPASWVLPPEYQSNLIWLLDNYPHDEAVVVFPWKWNVNFVDSAWDTDNGAAARMAPYRLAAATAANLRGARFVDLSLTYNAPTFSLDPLPPYLCDGLIHASVAGHRGIATLIEESLTFVVPGS